jgi:hypothetical protein
VGQAKRFAKEIGAGVKLAPGPEQAYKREATHRGRGRGRFRD